MTAQELAQRILEIAHKALEQESVHDVIYIGDVCHAQLGLEDIVKLCEDVWSKSPYTTSSTSGMSAMPNSALRTL